MPQIFLAATPALGHVAPLRALAAHLVRRGHPVTFLTGRAFKSSIEATGARFVPFRGRADFDASEPGAFPGRAAVPAGPQQIDFDIRHIFADPVPDQHAQLQELLREADRARPGDPVVVIHDTVFMGLWPVLLGASGLRPAATIGIGVTPLPLTSIDTAPFGLGLPPDASDAGRARNRQLNRAVESELFVGAQQHLAAILRDLGATRPAPFVFNGMVSMPDRYLQLSIPALEYPRSDAPPGLRFVGALRPEATAFEQPAWWDRATGADRVVVVTQGTIANRDFDELIHPTLAATADMDVLTIVATGRTAARVTLMPPNAIVCEYVPFERLLPFADVLVTNGGYGGVQQALRHGVPLVLAGESEDKIEVNARVANTGAAINLRTARPGPAAVRDAVQRVFDDPEYRLRASRLQDAYAAHDALAMIDATVDELVG